MSHLKITQAGLIAAATTIIGQLVAFVPSFAGDTQILISAVSAAISAAFLLANAIHHLADSNVSVQDLKDGVIDFTRAEIKKVPFDQLVKEAVEAKSLGDVEQLVDAKVQQALANLFRVQPTVTGTSTVTVPGPISGPVASQPPQEPSGA